MIDIEEKFDTIEEMQAFINSIMPMSIYNDVEELKTQVTNIAEIQNELINTKLSVSSDDLTDKDLNEQIGKIIFGYGNNCVNRPNGANGYLINIPHCKSPETHNTQLWVTRPKAGLFIRNMESGAWTSWTPIYSDSGWQTLPLASGVSQQNESVYPCRYRKLSNVVYVEGAVKGFAEIQKVVATLPEGYRPSKSFYVQTATNAGQTDTFMFRANGAIERMSTTRSPQSVDDYHFVNANFLVN